MKKALNLQMKREAITVSCATARRGPHRLWRDPACGTNKPPPNPLLRKEGGITTPPYFLFSPPARGGVPEGRGGGRGEVVWGFSILEIMAAITIIAFGLVGLLSLTLQSIKVQYVNRNALVSAYLAQEGLELARNIRDNNWLSGYGWDNGLTADNYIIDYTGAGSIQGGISGIDDSRTGLNLDGNGFYYHGSGNPSNYRRLITISGGANSLSVTSRVRYKEGGNNYDYVGETVLYDWR